MRICIHYTYYILMYMRAFKSYIYLYFFIECILNDDEKKINFILFQKNIGSNNYCKINITV